MPSTLNTAKRPPSSFTGTGASSEEALLARRFLEVVPLAMRAIRGEIRKIARAEVSVPQFRILAYLARNDRSTNAELAEFIGTSAPVMSRMITCLVRQGLVAQDRGARDRRQVELKLTAVGRRKFRTIKRQAQRYFESEFAQMSVRGRTAMAKGLSAMAKGLRSTQNRETGTPL